MEGGSYIGAMESSASHTAVIGGAGFLGRAIVRALVARGDVVTVIDARAPAELPAGARWIRGTVQDAAGLREALAGTSRVVHVAGRAVFTRAEGFRALRELHVGGAVNVVEAARAVGATRLVFGSTAFAFAASRDGIRHSEVSPCDRAVLDGWPYLLTMREAEEAAWDRCVALDVEFCALRPALVLGPLTGDTSGAGHRLVRGWGGLRRGCLRGRTTVCDVRDVAPVFARATLVGDPPEAAFLGGTALPVAELVARLHRPESVSRRVGAALRKVAGGGIDPVVSELAAASVVVDDGVARAALAYAPRPLADTLRDTDDLAPRVSGIAEQAGAP